MTAVLGELEVAQANPFRSGQGETPAHMAWFAPHRPAAVTQFRGEGGGAATQGLPLTRWTTSTTPGLRGALGDGGYRAERTKRQIGDGTHFFNLGPFGPLQDLCRGVIGPLPSPNKGGRTTEKK